PPAAQTLAQIPPSPRRRRPLPILSSASPPPLPSTKDDGDPVLSPRGNPSSHPPPTSPSSSPTAHLVPPSPHHLSLPSACFPCLIPRSNRHNPAAPAPRTVHHGRLLLLPAPTHHPVVGARPWRLPFHAVSVRPCRSTISSESASSPQQAPAPVGGDDANGPTGVPVPFSRALPGGGGSWVSGGGGVSGAKRAR
uniref:Uncharacterized protein n=1 Tax=Triticum urartu TaxID=4572 RepID=A0A8R7U8Q3_TRIUA